MITGMVNADREALLRLTLYDANEQPQELAGIVDTGFNGKLTLPPDIIQQLGLPLKRQARAMLADGREIVTPVYEVKVAWDSQLRVASVVETDADPLVGMSLMYGYELVLPVLDGAEFTLRLIAAS